MEERGAAPVRSQERWCRVSTIDTTGGAEAGRWFARHRPGRCSGLTNGRPCGARLSGAAVFRQLESLGISPERAASHQPRATPWATYGTHVHGQEPPSSGGVSKGARWASAARCQHEARYFPAIFHSAASAESAANDVVRVDVDLRSAALIRRNRLHGFALVHGLSDVDRDLIVRVDAGGHL